jgi:hypothetical protein
VAPRRRIPYASLWFRIGHINYSYRDTTQEVGTIILSPQAIRAWDNHVINPAVQQVHTPPSQLTTKESELFSVGLVVAGRVILSKQQFTAGDWSSPPFLCLYSLTLHMFRWGGVAMTSTMNLPKNITNKLYMLYY